MKTGLLRENAAWIKWTVISFVFLCVFLVLNSKRSSILFVHQDEINFCQTGLYSYKTLVIEHDTTDPGWHDSFRSFGSPNPQIGKLLIGCSIWHHGFHDFSGVFNMWSHRILVKNILADGRFPPGKLAAGRLPVVLLSALMAALLSWLAMIATDGAGFSLPFQILSAITVVLLFLPNQTVHFGAFRAMLDAPAAAFSTTAIVLSIITLNRIHQNSLLSGFLFSIGSGIATGLAISTKMNAILSWTSVLASIPAFAILLYMRGKLDRNRQRTLIGAWISQLLIPPIVFVGSNPYLYKNTWRGICQMFAFGNQIIQRKAHLPKYALYTLSDKISSFFRSTTTPIASFRSPMIKGSLCFLMFAGILTLLYLLWKNWRFRIVSDFCFTIPFLAWLCATVLGVIWWTPLSWNRYYLPAIPPLLILESIGLTTLVWVAIHRKLPLKKTAENDHPAS